MALTNFFSCDEDPAFFCNLGFKFLNTYFEELQLPLRSSDQSSWLQIQRSGFDSRRYQIFREVVGLEWGPLSLVSTTEELLERESSSSGLEIRESPRANYTDRAAAACRRS
jgi:hypothetical protein